MATSKDFLEFVLAQLSDLDGISYRQMMGEYIIYYYDKILGGLYDNKLMVKPLISATRLLPNSVPTPPYDGAKGLLVVEQVEDKEFLKKTMKRLVDKYLDERERLVVNMRFGLIDDVQMTQQNVADKLVISRSYVSRIEKRALNKIKKAINDEELQL